MEAPITYEPGFLRDNHFFLFQMLWERLDWVRIDKVPRREYYCNRMGVPYSYGTPPYDRTYQSQPINATLEHIWTRLEEKTQTPFEVCFLNGYEDGSDQLGWHADDSPEMDDSRPIAIVSLGAQREIWFRRKDPEHRLISCDRLWLRSGSLCLMSPGMQDTHQHRIPKSSVHNCGPRISLTFRGYAK